jgi:hypothetical protein
VTRTKQLSNLILKLFPRTKLDLDGFFENSKLESSDQASVWLSIALELQSNLRVNLKEFKVQHHLMKIVLT